ncbi:OPT/YSL family transporter [Arthrobacter sp. MI7-26]|uniref:OPT/YSL family transporter n=1 Tax=Arthrobacter sp. MI7-26 TaxID=2993653 RepID=UPI002248D59A|nr:OPT/YSL family transporter [Arthrobacter sp. MI7-26]MCX2747865.1 OPT/YSL family transporter [Arthrobacter sp. MI7-26]
MAQPLNVKDDTTARHPRAFEPVTLVVTVLLSILGAVIGLHMITTIGISANTSVIGALIAMIIGRISFFGLAKMRDINRQNLAQSAISGATFAAANSLLTPIAVPFAFGRTDLVGPMLVGASMGLLIDAWILYKSFGSRFLPADAAWPPGVAAAETILAGDKGGKRALLMAAGGAIGVGASLFGLPMSAAGVALIGNVWALGMFAAGLLVSQYAPAILHFTLSSIYVPHGVMIGAGIVALVQAVRILLDKKSAKDRQKDQILAQARAEAPEDPSLVTTVSAGKLRRTFTSGYFLYVAGALILATLGGIWTQMSVPAVIAWILFAAVAAIIHELIVGLAAMHAGWFPAFAVTLIFLVAGLLLQIPAVPLALLVGYCAATGPAFADMGYDLKAGWILRRENRPYTAFEIEGRRQQLLSAMIGFTVAIGLVALLWNTYFTAGHLPPAAMVYADTIKAGLTNPDVIRNLILWAIPGAIIQIIGGAKRQMGVLLATGLLIGTPNAGWLVLTALLFRFIWTKYRPQNGETEVSLIGAGLIAGDSVYSVGQIFKG